MSEKLCKDCKWCRRDWLMLGSHRFARCTNPKSYVIHDLVNGVKKQKARFCEVQRFGDLPIPGYCNKEAVWFEPKK